AQGTPLIDILNYRFVAAEIMVTLVGCFGLISAAPLTSYIASRIMISNSKKMLQLAD
ncbi:MAG: YibE/F family protein, partial [Christensenellales bacterium]